MPQEDSVRLCRANSAVTQRLCDGIRPGSKRTRDGSPGESIDHGSAKFLLATRQKIKGLRKLIEIEVEIERKGIERVAMETTEEAGRIVDVCDERERRASQTQAKRDEEAAISKAERTRERQKRTESQSKGDSVLRMRLCNVTGRALNY